MRPRFGAEQCDLEALDTACTEFLKNGGETVPPAAVAACRECAPSATIPPAPQTPCRRALCPPRKGEESETLRLVFSTHEIQIDNINLRDLVLGFQDFAIKWLRAVPERYHAVAPIRDGVITSLQIASVD